jgi:hypothetical protein
MYTQTTVEEVIRWLWASKPTSIFSLALFCTFRGFKTLPKSKNHDNLPSRTQPICLRI